MSPDGLQGPYSVLEKGNSHNKGNGPYNSYAREEK